MRINQNISALNAYRNMVGTENRLNKSLERLSSGLRINRAADDAAGLAISEKMRGQIKGLNQAMSNAQDGISLIQTAEGALNETHSILQRMRELSVQAANDTLTAGDRMEIQKEIDQLTQEIDRIANTTEFNTKKLLDGTTSALTSTDDLKTQVFMRDGLRTIDQFGQKAVEGGNFKLEIEAEAGEGQVQKTDIMKAKHEAGAKLEYEQIHGDDGDDKLFMAALDDDVVVEFTDLSAGTTTSGFTVSVTDSTISIGLGTADSTYEELFQLIAQEDDAADLVQMKYEGDITATITNVADLDLVTGGTTATLELDDPILASGDPEFEAIIGSTASGLSTHALEDDVTITIHDTGLTGSFTVDFDSTENHINVYAGTAATTQDIYDALIAEEGITELLNFEITDDGVNLESDDFGTYDLSGLGNYVDVGDIAREDTALSDIDRFWDASGNFLVEDPQTITLVQGDGKQTSFTIFGTDTIGDVEEKLNDAIHNGLEQSDVNTAESEGYATYVSDAEDDGFFSVEGTFIIQSAITGGDGEITFVGDEGVINALSLTTVQESSETQYTIDITDAHSGEVVAEDINISGNMLIGEVHENVDVKFDAMAGVEFGTEDGTFAWSSGDTHETFVHLADNSMVFHIGANQLQDVDAAIGDMRAEALGVHNILVTDRGGANEAIGTIDNAINSVSAERSKMGALQNRLEHTINNLGVAAENLTAAESRIRDLDFAQEMIEFTRNQIMSQAGTSMLAQANMKPQSVLMLLG